MAVQRRNVHMGGRQLRPEPFLISTLPDGARLQSVL